jgi:hypothetical protein
MHCKKIQKQDYISFHHILILNNSHNDINIKFIVEVYASLYYYKHESKLQQNPKFCWKKSQNNN